MKDECLHQLENIVCNLVLNEEICFLWWVEWPLKIFLFSLKKKHFLSFSSHKDNPPKNQNWNCILEFLFVWQTLHIQGKNMLSFQINTYRKWSVILSHLHLFTHNRHFCTSNRSYICMLNSIYTDMYKNHWNNPSFGAVFDFLEIHTPHTDNLLWRLRWGNRSRWTTEKHSTETCNLLFVQLVCVNKKETLRWVLFIIVILYQITI